MSLDVTLYANDDFTGELWSGNITHNLNKMASEIGIYKHVWRPEEVGIERAKQMIAPLTLGICYLKWNYLHFRQYEPANKWGLVENLQWFLKDYHEHCLRYPHAKVKAYR